MIYQNEFVNDVRANERAAVLVRAVGVCKSFGSRSVLNDYSLELGIGLHALVGPNGVGKSTLLAILAGALDPDRGNAFICGHLLNDDDLQGRACVGYMPDVRHIYPFMTGSDMLDLVRAAKNLPRTAGGDVVDGFLLNPHLRVAFGDMSEGTRRKFCIAAAFIGDAPVLFLDEPTNGLDSRSLDFLRAELTHRSAAGCVLVATHDTDIVDAPGVRVVSLQAAQRDGAAQGAAAEAVDQSMR